jgi:alpha-tubulin suppressor-like RCC1 family protein
MQPSQGSTIGFAKNSSSINYLWGSNSYGGLGKDATIAYSPVQIGTQSDWTQVVYGTNHALALRSGTLYLWGANSWGQLGQGDVTHRSSPVQLGPANSWASVAAGDVFSAATKADGTLWAWGNNSYGQLGQGNYTHRSSPVQVGTISQYVSVYATANTLLANLY